MKPPPPPRICGGSPGNEAAACVQVTADVYAKIDKELLQMCEDVLLNRREDATERMLDYAATLDPKSRPTALRKLGGEAAAPAGGLASMPLTRLTLRVCHQLLTHSCRHLWLTQLDPQSRPTALRKLSGKGAAPQGDPWLHKLFGTGREGKCHDLQPFEHGVARVHVLLGICLKHRCGLGQLC